MDYGPIPVAQFVVNYSKKDHEDNKRLELFVHFVVTLLFYNHSDCILSISDTIYFDLKTSTRSQGIRYVYCCSTSAEYNIKGPEKQRCIRHQQHRRQGFLFDDNLLKAWVQSLAFLFILSEKTNTSVRVQIPELHAKWVLILPGSTDREAET
jgi:hypothetical protein